MDRPGDAKIEDWLAGKLPVGEAAELEQYFESHPGEFEVPSVDHELLRSCHKQSGSHNPAITQLIELLKSEHESSALPHDFDFLTPHDKPGILGTLGSYEVLQVIATGGMAIVFKAYDPELDRVAALKVLSPELASNQTAKARFLREARAAAKLEHENILPIYSIHSEPVPWFAMRYVGGGSLQDLLDLHRKLLDHLSNLERLKEIAAQTASALQIAHEAGIVHRDIKPGNILLDEDGEKIWLCDFGIARSKDDPTLTYAGSVAGTPHYMSPEQAEGKEVDGRSDLFSLGSVLYHCATGYPPFQGESSAAVLQKVTTASPIPATELNPKVPSWFGRLLANLHAKNPDDRFASAEEMKHAVDSEKIPVSKKLRRRRRLITLSVLVPIVAFLFLQIPLIENLLRNTISSATGRSIHIEGRFFPEKTLAGAIKAAADGDVIVLSGEEFVIDHLEIPPGKSLTIRAQAPSEKPTLTTSRKGRPGIVSHAFMRFENLNFRLNATPAGEGLLILHEDAIFEGCRFHTRHGEEGANITEWFRAIELRAGKHFIIRDCEFDLEGVSAFSIDRRFQNSRGLRIEVENSRLSAAAAVHLLKRFPPDKPLEISLKDTEFSGLFFMRATGGGSASGTVVTAKDSTFSLVYRLCWFRARGARFILKNFRWRAENCHYTPGKATVYVGADPRRSDPLLVREISDFEGDPPVTAIPSGLAKFLSNGKEYRDLATAIAEAPAGETLLLSGTLNCPESIITPEDKELYYRSAEGESAVVRTQNSKSHLLFIRGRTSLHGITFIRSVYARGALPIVGIKNHEAEISNCHFETILGNHDDARGAGLSITNSPLTRVSRCTFRIPRGAGIHFAHGGKGSGPVRAEVEDCLFLTDTMFSRRSRDPGHQLTFTVARCVGHGACFFSKSSRNDFHPMEVSIRDCILDLNGTFFSLPDTSAEVAEKNLVWHGERNFYSGPATFPNTQDQSADFGPLFKREDLIPPITPQSLRRALARPIECPALEILK